MSSVPVSPLAEGGVAGSSSGKQLHPSESQLAAEAELGIVDPSPPGAAAAGAPVMQTLLAPKPTVIETRAGPVSPKVSPRLMSRNLGDRGASRSPAYSANSSPRGNSRGLSASCVDECSPVTIDRRGSGNFSSPSTLSNLVSLDRSAQGTLAGSASSGSLLIASPTLVRRASRPMVLHAGTNSALQALLSRYTVSDMQTSRKVIELSSTVTPAEGFELLLKNKILSAPVYDEAKKEYIGFLDVRDLVSSIVFAHEEQRLTSTLHEVRATTTHWNELMLASLQRFGTGVSVTYLSRRNPFRPIASSASLLAVSRALSSQLHRLPVVDAAGKCVSIISQSSLVQFLHAHRDEVKADLQQTISHLGLGLCKVISVASDASAWQAFKVLELNSVSGIAIVDRDGKLVGNTSARDLKYFVQNKGNLSLDAPIQDYLARIRTADEAVVDEVHPSAAVAVNTSIAHCIGLLAATGYHRVFIVDANGRPIGVVSVTDILRFAAAEAAPSGTASASPSNPTTPRKHRADLTTASTSPQTTAGHLRTHSQSAAPIVTPVPAPTSGN